MTVPSSTIASSLGFGRVGPLLTGLGRGVGHRRAEYRVAGRADGQCYRPAAQTESAPRRQFPQAARLVCRHRRPAAGPWRPPSASVQPRSAGGLTCTLQTAGGSPGWGAISRLEPTPTPKRTPTPTANANAPGPEVACIVQPVGETAPNQRVWPTGTGVAAGRRGQTLTRTGGLGSLKRAVTSSSGMCMRASYTSGGYCMWGWAGSIGGWATVPPWSAYTGGRV